MRRSLKNKSTHATGDGLIMCQETGALVVNLYQSLLPYLGGVSDPDSYFEGNTLLGGYHGEAKSLQY
jgi:hypothetical protein